MPVDPDVYVDPKVEINISDHISHAQVLQTVRLAGELVNARHKAPQDILQVLHQLFTDYTAFLAREGYEFHIEKLPTSTMYIVTKGVVRND